MLFFPSLFLPPFLPSFPLLDQYCRCIPFIYNTLTNPSPGTFLPSFLHLFLSSTIQIYPLTNPYSFVYSFGRNGRSQHSGHDFVFERFAHRSQRSLLLAQRTHVQCDQRQCIQLGTSFVMGDNFWTRNERKQNHYLDSDDQHGDGEK